MVAALEQMTRGPARHGRVGTVYHPGRVLLVEGTGDGLMVTPPTTVRSAPIVVQARWGDACGPGRAHAA